MTDYVSAALFVYSPEAKHLCEPLQNNVFGTRITLLEVEALEQEPDKLFKNTNHVVVSGNSECIKKVLALSMEYSFSVGLLLSSTQDMLSKTFDIPKNQEDAIRLALKEDSQPMDLILCNEKIILSKATIGWIPLLDSPSDANKFTILVRSIQKFRAIRLFKFGFTTANEQKISTAASGCMIVQRHKGSTAAKLIESISSVKDNAISLIIASPYSVINYLTFLTQVFKRTTFSKRLPSGIGFIKSSEINITSEVEMDVFIDDEKATTTPLNCKTIPDAVRINVGDWLEQENKNVQPAKESIRVDNIPDEKETIKSAQKKIPFFSYASEERFRDLLMALRDDARNSSIFITLMILSTALAAVGLYLNNSAVIIGAMLLAPLMSPIVAFAMGILRQDRGLLRQSAYTIVAGVIIALLTSALITLLFPHKPITAEMQGRLNPTLLDMAVAIISGIAAAYSKSYKEIIQSLAGVAIAVALVPPLAVAGIGIGRADFFFFFQAFLLFSTNLIGIMLAATITFRVLGYSPVVRSKNWFYFVAVSLIAITIPLYLSYERIVSKVVFEKKLQTERFLVNGKYIIIKKAHISRRGDKDIILMDIAARENLNRKDLNLLKRKIQIHFDRDLVIRTRIIYIL